MAADFLQHFKSELPAGFADFFQRKLQTGEMNFDSEPTSPQRSPSPDDPERRMRIDKATAFKNRGAEPVDREDFAAAEWQYAQAVLTLAGEGFCVPAKDGSFIRQKYLELDEVERSMLMSSCAALGSAIFNASVVSGRNDSARVCISLEWQ